MALLTLEEASARYGVSHQALEEWEAGGLLEFQKRPCHENGPPGSSAPQRVETCVDEEQLAEVVERVGWLRVSSEAWDREE